MKTSKRDNVDISNLMQSIEQTEKVNVETDKFPTYVDSLVAANKKFEEIFEEFKNITSKPILFSFKQESLDEFRSEKNGYIEEEKDLLAQHRAEILRMLGEHEQKIRNIIQKGEGIWLSDFWMKFLVDTIYSAITVLAIALWLK